MQAPRIRLAPQSPEFSRIAPGLWRLAEWQLTPGQQLALIEPA